MQFANQSSGSAPLDIFVASAVRGPASARCDEYSITDSNVSSHRRLPSLVAAKQYAAAPTQRSAYSDRHDWLYSIEMAMSWIIALVFEGLVMYGRSAFLYFPDNLDQHEHDAKAPATSRQKAIAAAAAKPHLAASVTSSLELDSALIRQVLAHDASASDKAIGSS